MKTKHLHKADYFNSLRSSIGRKVSKTLGLINDRYNSIIEDIFLDDDVKIERLPENGLEYGSTFEWNYRTNDTDSYLSKDELQDEDPNIITKIRRSIHLYMELDTLDPEEKFNTDNNPAKKNMVIDSESASKKNMRLFRLSRWNIIRVYFKNVFKAISAGIRILKTVFSDSFFIARIYIPHTINEMKIRGPSQRC